MPIAYLNTEYPALSHTFIEREVRAVRALGVAVRTFSIRRPGAHGRLGPEQARAERETGYVLDGADRLLASALSGIARRPIGALRALGASQGLSPPGLRARAKHMAYWLESIRLARLVRGAGASHIHVHMANNGAAVAKLACAYDRDLSYSLTIHGSAEFFHIDSWRVPEKCEGAAFVRFISNVGMSSVMAWTRPGLWDRFHVVRCGIDPDVFRPRAGIGKRRADPLRLVSVGRLHPVKGYGVLLDAMGLLKRRGVGVTLTMIGDGPMRERLEALVRSHDLGDRVTFAGALAPERVRDALLESDAMALSSFMEGVPIVLMEAMACGLPVVATRVGGVPELVEDGVSGLLAPPGDAEAFAEAIERLVSCDLRAMGRAGRARVERDYALDSQGERMAALLRRYAGEAPATEAAPERASVAPIGGGA